jgi:16S rRNA (guanine(966)-N(2))-methyltransferase RsmD
MRVIAGKYRSRNLQSLQGDDTRPTYDRLRETLFNVLSAAGKLEGQVFVDLFAGTGAVGIEALSRGAAHVYFAESAKKAAQVIRTNLQSLGVTDEADVYERSAVDTLRVLSENKVRPDVVFLDPPYKLQGAYEQVLRVVEQSGVLATGGIIVAEHEKRFDPGNGTERLQRYRCLVQGESSLSFYRLTSNADETASL